MRYGLTVPNFGPFFDAREVAGLAREAEGHGWDGFFVWDHIHAAWERGVPVADPWVLLTALALATDRIRIGPMVTPLPRRRPWKLARETVTLDHLSAGRLVLGVGLGFPPDLEYEALGEDADDHVRAGRLDEGLEVLTGLWTGEAQSHRGTHFRLDEVLFRPAPTQTPRIPVWVGGTWPAKAPFRRAARWDGVFPIGDDGMPLALEPFREAVAYVRKHRSGGAPFEAVAGHPDASDEDIAAFGEAGATWWMAGGASPDEIRLRIREGPPRI